MFLLFIVMMAGSLKWQPNIHVINIEDGLVHKNTTEIYACHFILISFLDNFI